MHQPDGDIQGESFSQVETISSYIPQVASDHFTHPLLAVNIDYVDESIFDWSDPERSHSYYDLTRDAEQLLKGSEDVCHRAFSQIRHWPPGETDAEAGERATKSALRRSKDNINGQRNSVSWSSKVTCKTYSKDDPNNYDFFNANASTSEGMNFNGHPKNPLYDPHAQNEGRVMGNQPNFDPYAPQNNGHGQIQQNQQQQPPSPHFDQYQGTGLDYANQQPDQMYGDSQNQQGQYVDSQNQDGASWEGSEEGAGSFDNSASSGSSRTGSSFASSGSGSRGSFNQQQQGFNEDGSGSGGSSRGSVASSSRGSAASSRSSSTTPNQQEHYDVAYSTGSSASGGLPPMT